MKREYAATVTCQRGITLIEVMIAVFVTAVGLLGAAAMQLQALKYTDSSRLTSQASFVVYDIIDRMRAAAPSAHNSYSLTAIADSPCSSDPCQTDMADFIDNVRALPGGEGSVTIDNSRATVEVSWSEARAAGEDAQGNERRSGFSVTTSLTVTPP